MGFAAGPVTFRRFAVIGQAPSMVDEQLLEKLQAHRLLETDSSTDESAYGWCGGRHVLDADFSFEHNVYADCLLFALRIDTNRVPSDLKKAYQIMEEEAAAAGNPSGFISKQQKRDVKDVVRRKVDEDLRDGKFRRSKLVPLLWDFQTSSIYSSASAAAFEKLAEIFERTFSLTLDAQSAGSHALRTLQKLRRKRDYEDLKPTRFTHAPDGDNLQPEYPWVLKGPQPKDFLGNEFLLWLWHESEFHGSIATESLGAVSVLPEKSIDLDCAFGLSGRDFLRAASPTRSPEARDALKSGKIPRKMTMTLECAGEVFPLTLGAETLTISGAKLPDIEEAENPRVVFEERIGHLRSLCQAIDGLYEAFLQLRASSAWESHASTMRRWISASAKQVAVVA